MKKAIYVFSSSLPGSEDGVEGKVVHVNHVPDAFRSKGVDGRTWASKVSEIIGGKVGRDLIPHLFVLKLIC